MICCSDLRKDIPGGVYLCQVGDSVSCGACCGLYNVQDARLESLETVLSRRTGIFQNASRDVDGILAFKEVIESEELQDRPYPDFHHCPYLGLIGEAGLRVGCLLHPMAHGNNGVDLRGLSFYGGMACRVYFCPSYHGLSPAWKKALAQSAPHWHLYGLIVTETDMLGNFFKQIENRIKRSLWVEDICDNDKAVEILWDFFALKLEWPFRNRTLPVWGNYFFHDDMYAHPVIDYSRIDGSPSRYDPIFRALRSDFHTSKELKDAECMIDEMVETISLVISSPSSSACGGFS